MPRTGWEDVRRALALRAPGRVPDASLGHAAVALVLRDASAGLELLFIRRAEHDADPWSGQMGFPGGRAEPGDADLIETAIRETREELGLELARDAALLGRLDEVRARARMRPQSLVIAPHVFRLEGAADPVPGPEVTSAHWLPLDEIRLERRLSTMDYSHEGATLEFPCLRYDDLVIWGLTFRMFMSFRERLDATAPTAPGASDAVG